MESRRFTDDAFEYSTVVREIRGVGPVPAGFEGAPSPAPAARLGQIERRAR